MSWKLQWLFFVLFVVKLQFVFEIFDTYHEGHEGHEDGKQKRQGWQFNQPCLRFLFSRHGYLSKYALIFSTT
jgi:hypothetical protein